MKRYLAGVLIALSAMFLVACGSAPIAQPQSLLSVDYRLIETRYCGEPERDSRGVIIRSSAVLREFQKIHPCPSTGLTTGSCPGWSKDHVIPLVCNGCDIISNVAWMPLVIKAGAGKYPKDRWEQKVYCSPQVLVPMPVPPLPQLVVQ